MSGYETQIYERQEFQDGVKAALPVVAAIAPFGAVYGAAAVSKGMEFSDAVFMSGIVFAGASQMVAVDLLATPIPFWTIVLSVFAVNFRHILYSASLGRKMHRFGPVQKAVAFFFLIDPQWAICERRTLSKQLTVGYYFGLAAPVWVIWLLSSALGAVFGKLVTNPYAIAFDFILPLYFIGLLMGFRQQFGWFPVVLISGASALVASWVIGPPWHVAGGTFVGIVYAAWRGKPESLTELAPKDKFSGEGSNV